MSAIVSLALHNGGRTYTDIDLDRLTPRARAIAEQTSRNPLRTRGTICLQSVQTLRELGADVTFYGEKGLDAHHRTAWSGWADYPRNHPLDPHDYLEREARKLPIGYVVVDPGPGERRADPAQAADADRIDKAHALELLRELGHPLSARTWDDYRSERRRPEGFPTPVDFIGRTPRWSEREIRAYVAAKEARA